MRLFSRKRRASTSAGRILPGDGRHGAGAPRCDPRVDVARFGRPAVCVYDAGDGLPQNDVSAIAFDSKGYLGVGTVDGAARYNGRAWTVVDMPKQTLSNWVRTMLACSDGRLWFGTYGGGLASLLDGDWTIYDTSSGLPSNQIRCLLETEDRAGSSLWVGTSGGGVARLKAGRWTVYDVANGLPDDNICCLLASTRDGSQTIWAGTYGGGLARLEDVETGRWTVYGHASGLPSETVWSLLEVDDGGPMLIAGTGAGLARFDGTRWTPFGACEALGNSVLSLHATVGPDGSTVLWAGTHGGGLVRFPLAEPEAWSILDTSSTSLQADVILQITSKPGESPAREVWVGTNGGGLARVALGGWVAYDEKRAQGTSSLPHGDVWSLAEARESDGTSEIWVGTGGGGVARFARGEWAVYDAASGALPDDRVLALCTGTDEHGRSVVWAGTNAGGLARFAEDRWEVFHTSPEDGAIGLPNDGVLCLLETEVDGVGCPALLAGTMGGGLARFADGQWTIFDSSDGLPNDVVVCLLETGEAASGRESALWVGTSGGGLARFANNCWTVFDSSSGLPNDVVISLLETRFASGRDGRPRRTLWAGTHGGGVARLELDAPNGRWVTLSTETLPALPSNSIYQLRQDAEGRIYLFTNRGVARLTHRTPTPDDASEFDVFVFTTEDGLPSDECNSGASMVDARGRVWAGTVKGAAMLDPALEIPARTGQALVVEHAICGPDERSLLPNASLAHDESKVAFEFALLSFFRERDTRYRTQLQGFERAPSEWNDEVKRGYMNLAAGSYVFHVWARDYAGNVTGPVSREFRVRPAPWRTLPAYALYVGALAGLAYGGVRVRTQTLRKRNEDLEAKVAEQTADLEAKVEQLEVSDTRARQKAEELAHTVELLRVLEQNAREAKEEAIAASRAKSVFLSNMSHELRTPLNAVIGFAQLMARDRTLDSRQLENLAVILRGSEHLLGLITDVLSISKIEAGKLTLVEEAFDLEQLLESVVAMVRTRARIKGIHLVPELAPGLPGAVRGDAVKLRQVLLNLLGNAVKFTSEGEIVLRASWDGHTARFEVADTGSGIEEEALPRVFDPFVQARKGMESKEGTGLGLAICRNIVQLMGGDISVESKEGEGSLFRFHVKLQGANATELWREERRVVRLESNQPEYRVLVADDSPENRTLLVTLLTAVGFEAREASDGKQAVEVWEAWRPHLVWMDMRMPGVNGYEATRRIRAAEREEVGSGEWGVESTDTLPEAVATPPEADTPRGREGSSLSPLPTKIIALTASAFETDRRDIIEAGCDDFVTKPYRESTIFEKMVEHLGVLFVYELPSAPGTVEPVPALPERIAKLPPELCMSLNKAVLEGDVDAAHRTIRAIRDRDPGVASELAAMIKTYRFDEVLALLDAASLTRSAEGVGS
jgi:signal transduction histidine kinase/ligand-binding sensor domain-containing protein/CheY-like chemotaxis protein